MKSTQLRTYKRSECVVFSMTNEKFGGLSNMAKGYPLNVNDIQILTSEALYQACRFPHHPEIQSMIINQKSPITAKMKTKPYKIYTRPDWLEVRVRIMKWCLRVKLAQNWEKFSALLLATEEKAIVELSRKDFFWGAKLNDDQTLIGINCLGRLLMELRENIRVGNQAINEIVEPLKIDNFLLFGNKIEHVSALFTITQQSPLHNESKKINGKELLNNKQESFFDQF